MVKVIERLKADEQTRRDVQERALCNKRGALVMILLITLFSWLGRMPPFFHVEYDTTTLQTIQYENTFQNF